MLIKKWEKLPSFMQIEEVKEYYLILRKKNLYLFFKRVFDILISFLMLILLFPLFLILAIAIKIDSKGPVFYRQERVSQYGKRFRIFKFRSMFIDADKKGSLTIDRDARITRVGHFIRRFRLDEICQLIDILRGTMTFIGTRPEVPKYVDQYSNQMLATLLLPAGVTSLSSIYFKDEADLLKDCDDADRVYISEVLPKKMYFNLKGLKEMSLLNDIKILIMTVLAVCGKKYKYCEEKK